MPYEPQSQEVIQRFPGAGGGDVAALFETPQGLRDLDVEQVGRVEDLPRRQ